MRLGKTFLTTLIKFKHLDAKLVNNLPCIGEKALHFLMELIVFFNKNVNHTQFESGTSDAQNCNKLLADLEDLLEIDSGLKNKGV